MSSLTTLEEKLKTMQPNMSTIAEYKQKDEQYLQRAKELDDATNMSSLLCHCYICSLLVVTTQKTLLAGF